MRIMRNVKTKNGDYCIRFIPEKRGHVEDAIFFSDYVNKDKKYCCITQSRKKSSGKSVDDFFILASSFLFDQNSLSSYAETLEEVKGFLYKNSKKTDDSSGLKPVRSIRIGSSGDSIIFYKYRVRLGRTKFCDEIKIIFRKKKPGADKNFSNVSFLLNMDEFTAYINLVREFNTRFQ